MGYNHETESGDGSPGIAEIRGSEFEVTDVAGEHDRDKKDEVKGGVGENQGQREQHLLLGLRQINHPPYPFNQPFDSLFCPSHVLRLGVVELRVEQFF